MNIWELSKEHYNWESPITKIYGDIQNDIVRQEEENYMCAIKQAIGYEVDKEELIRALQYDREQYDKGYNDGVKETFTEELKKIKAEIEKLEYDDFDCNLVLPAWKVYAIIDTYIEELKGGMTYGRETYVR